MQSDQQKGALELINLEGFHVWTIKNLMSGQSTWVSPGTALGKTKTGRPFCVLRFPFVFVPLNSSGLRKMMC